MSILKKIKGFIFHQEPLPERPAPRAPIEPFKTVIKAKSSSGGFYDVTFICKDDRLWLKCTCIAGKFSQFCKHKFQLLEGNEAWLYDSDCRSELAHIQAVLPQTNFPMLLDYYKETQKQNNPAAIKEAKIQLKLAMRQGA
ncbi:MAG: hypothetical protein WC600_17060 [Desulfobaccales bacterium]